jgi:hypothetical protein
MVLIDCPTCRRRLTVAVQNCPGCGRALERKKDRRLRMPILLDVVVFLGAASLLGWFLWWLVSGPSFI